MSVIVLSCFLLALKCTDCAKILGIFPGPSVSHQAIFKPIWKELSLRGHQVTVITPNPFNEAALTNLTEIDVSFAYDVLEKGGMIKSLYKDSWVFQKVYVLFETGLKVVEAELKFEAVQELIRNEDMNFDLVIVQNTHNWVLIPSYFARFKAPVVAISSLSLFLHSHDALGNPTHPVTSPDMMLNFSEKLAFFDRLQSLLFNFWYRMFYYWYALPKADRIARKYFGDDMPYLGDLEKNISLLLLNVNPIIHNVRPNVPNIIEINQMHIRDLKPLPTEIQEYLDSSSQGVVYFSLGSNVKSANLTDHLRREIVAALSELPYKVLWKWETDHLPDQPANVLTRKWLPQQEVLAHPNVKVFVTQGGLQSIEEAITYEVPMVGLPFITDQPSNIKKIVDLGMGIGIDHQTLTKEQLKNAILEVAENKKYRMEVQKSRAILVDQPMKGVEKAVWWIEYVIRHKGAKHLRSEAADMSFFQYFMVDVILFLLVCISLIFYCIYKLASVLRQLIKPKNKIKTN